MNISVRYYTRSGNTRKLANAIAEAIDVQAENIGKVVCFGTSAMMKSTHKPMKKVTDEAGVCLVSEEFHCRGSFGPMHKDRPNEKDLQDAADFAKKITRL